MIERMMSQLSKDLELPRELEPKSTGVYILPLEEDLQIHIDGKDGILQLSATLAECPRQNQEHFFGKMLNANLFGQGTYGSTLGLDEDGKFITLQRTVDYPVEYKEFKDIIEDFINALDLWREEVASQQNPSL